MHHQQEVLASVRGHRSQRHDVVVAVARCLLTDLDPLCASVAATRRLKAGRPPEDGLQDRRPVLILVAHGPPLDRVPGRQDASLQGPRGRPGQVPEAAAVRAATPALHGGLLAAGHGHGRSQGAHLYRPAVAGVRLV